MAIGRTFQESYQKAARSLETGLLGFGCSSRTAPPPLSAKEREDLKHSLRTPNPDRMLAIHTAMAAGMSEKEVHELTNIDPWFLAQFGELIACERFLQSTTLGALTPSDWLQLKRKGFSDRQLAAALGSTEGAVRETRTKDRKSTRLNSSHEWISRMPSSA